MFMRVQSLAFARFWRDRCLVTPDWPQGKPVTQRDVLHFLRNALPAALKTEPVPHGDGGDNDPDEWAEAAKRALLEFVRALEEGRVTIVEEPTCRGS